MESLDWSSPRFKIARSQTHMKPYKGPSDFRKAGRRYDPSDFMSNHFFELIEPDEEFPDLDISQGSIPPDLSTSERIRLPS